MIRGQAAAAPDCWKSLTKRSSSIVLPALRPRLRVRINPYQSYAAQSFQQCTYRARFAAVDAPVPTPPPRLA